jgi:hypothetical protein
MNAKIRVAGICAALAVLALMVLLLVRPSLDPAHIRPLPFIIVAWLAFLTAAWLLRKVPLRLSMLLILLGGIAIQAAAVSAPPQNSNDLYRYIWDGQVQAAGIDPYAYSPASTHLDGLRNDFLWYPDAEYCVKSSQYFTSGCTRINRPTVHTIYPPVAEAYFLAVHYEPDATTSTTPLQSTTAGFAVLTTALLLFGLRRLRRDIRMAALWAWCPTVALEAGNSAHVDVVAVAITVAALLLLATARNTRRTVAGGVLLGLAIATKMTPALTVPALLRRRWLAVATSAASAVVVVYIPHLLAVGGKVIGFMPGYLQQEGYENGTRFGIIDLVVGGKAAIVVAVLVMAGVALAVLRFADPDQPWRGAVVMTATALAVATPHYQWYSLLLVVLVALDGRPEWLAFAAGGYYAAEPGMGHLTVPWPYTDAFGYGMPVLVVTAGWLIRRHLAERGAAPATVPSTAAAVAAATVAAATAPPILAEPIPAGTARAEPILARPVTAGPLTAGPVAAVAAEEAAISAPPLRSILADDEPLPLPRRVRV